MDSLSSGLVLGLAWYVVFLFSTTVHEAAHAWAALLLGDTTAYHGGQVSLNPLPHVQREPLGMVAVPAISFILMRGAWMFGWASAPYDPIWADRHPRRAGCMALAGPASNLVLFLLATLLIRLGMLAGWLKAPLTITFTQVTAAADGGAAAGLATLLSLLFSLNLILLVFNLLPLPPLDGTGFVQVLLPPHTSRRWLEILHQPMMAWVGIVVAWRLFGVVFWPIHTAALKVLYPTLVYQ
jgi:Zn-dependent protease